MKQFQQMQEKMQREIEALEVEGTAGGGMVKVTMDGSKNIKKLVIDPEVVSKDEVEMLQDLVTAAFGDCARKVDEALQEKLGGMAGGMKIPGLF
jgi:DNA-binding YbaB/EbfC family protein